MKISLFREQFAIITNASTLSRKRAIMMVKFTIHLWSKASVSSTLVIWPCAPD